jgi:hypothetical protein
MRLRDQKAVRKIVRNQTKSATAIVHSVDCDRLNITLGNTSTLIRGVEVVGDARKAIPGTSLPLVWREGRPVVLQVSPGTSTPSTTSGSLPQIGAYTESNRLDMMTAYVNSAVSPIYKINNSQFSNGYVELVGDAIGDYVEWTFTIDAGLYEINALTLPCARLGIYQMYLDGVFLDENDLYSATTTYNVIWSVPATIINSGVHVLRLLCSGKTASSTNYNLIANWITICPTLS